MKKGKVVFNNLNDIYTINKTFSFENYSQFGRILLKMKLKPNYLQQLKFKRQENNNIKAHFNFQLFNNKIDEFTDNFSNAYFNNNLIKKT